MMAAGDVASGTADAGASTAGAATTQVRAPRERPCACQGAHLMLARCLKRSAAKT